MDQQCPHRNQGDADQPYGGPPLPDPYPDYVACLICGEPEVEVWCYETNARCHACGAVIPHQPPPCFGLEGCKGVQQKERK